MSGESKRLTELEAKQIALRFLFAKYFRSKIEFNDTELRAHGDAQLYHFRGRMVMRSHSWWAPFTAGKKANLFTFKIRVDAHRGTVIDYELT